MLQELSSWAILPSWESGSPSIIMNYAPGKGWKHSQVGCGTLGAKQGFFFGWANVDELDRRVKDSNYASTCAGEREG